MQEFSEETCVSDQLEFACQKWNNAALVWEHVTWALARDPKIGRPLNEEGTLRLLSWVGARSVDMPDVELMYRLENPTIRLLEVIFKDAKSAFSGTA